MDPVFITKDTLQYMLGGAISSVQSAFIDARLPLWDKFANYAGLTQDARAGVLYIAEIAHETDRLRTAREYGTASYFARYNNRADLGNGPNDGPRFPGRGDIQTTGRNNYGEANRRIVKLLGSSAFMVWPVPDFVARPEALEEPIWAVLSGLAWWQAHDLSRKAAQPGDMVPAVSRVINGGANGLADRCTLYARLFCAVSGTTIREFQRQAGLAVDGVAGPRTRAAMADALAGRTLEFRASGAVTPAPLPRPSSPPVLAPHEPAPATGADRLTALEAEVAALRSAMAELAAAVIAQRG